jgi:TolB protein
VIVGVIVFATNSGSAQDTTVLGRLPEGRLAFSSNRQGNYDIYLTDATGKVPENLTHSEENEFAPAWSGDGRYLAYVQQVGDDYQIGRVDIETNERHILTPLEPGKNYGTPAPSPDGSVIAFNAGPPGNFDLYLMDADGSNVRLLVAGAGTDFSPSWFPDGKRLVYIAQQGTEWVLQIVGVDGDDGGIIYTSSEEKRFAALSPDGSQVAFAMLDEDNWDIYVIPVAGSEPRRLTDNLGEDTYPSWSPSGDRILFMSTRDSEPPDARHGQLYMIPIIGGTEQRVFSDSPDDRQPTWRS